MGMFTWNKVDGLEPGLNGAESCAGPAPCHSVTAGRVKRAEVSEDESHDEIACLRGRTGVR